MDARCYSSPRNVSAHINKNAQLYTHIFGDMNGESLRREANCGILCVCVSVYGNNNRSL